MSDQTTDTFLMLMEATFEAAPQAPDLPSASERVRVVKRPTLALAAGFAAALLVVGAGAVVIASLYGSGDAVTTAPDSLQLRFDTSTLGIELGAVTGSPADLDEASFESNLKASLEANVRAWMDAGYGLAGPPAFIGRTMNVEGYTALFTHATEPDLACQIEVRSGRGTVSGVACGPETESHIGFLLLEGVNELTLFVSAWDPATAVIAVAHPSGEGYWQRTHNGGSVMAIPIGAADLGGITITAYNADGDVIGSPYRHPGHRDD